MWYWSWGGGGCYKGTELVGEDDWVWEEGWGEEARQRKSDRIRNTKADSLYIKGKRSKTRSYVPFAEDVSICSIFSFLFNQ